ncbi:MAG: hypothetical protein Q8P13_00050 [bacterium]|nr:hypothetical protein [bacterium]
MPKKDTYEVEEEKTTPPEPPVIPEENIVEDISVEEVVPSSVPESVIDGVVSRQIK